MELDESLHLFADYEFSQVPLTVTKNMCSYLQTNFCFLGMVSRV